MLPVLCQLHTSFLVLILVCDLKLLLLFLVLSYAQNISSLGTACSLAAVCFYLVCKDRYDFPFVVISFDSICKIFPMNFIMALLYCTYLLHFWLTFSPCIKYL